MWLFIKGFHFHRFRGVLLFLIGLAPCDIIANPGVFPFGNTGAPGSQVCTQCHFPSGSGGGSISLIFPSSSYEAGQTYTLRVQVADTGQGRFGFALAARNGANNLTSAGVLAAKGGNTIAQGGEVGQFNAPFASGSFEFQVDWTAPATGAGPVTFYFVGNAANGDNTQLGDFIYQSSLVWSESQPNQAPGIDAVQSSFEIASGEGVVLTGLTVSDADAGNAILSLNLEVANGVLSLAGDVPSGVQPGGISGSGTRQVQVLASLSQMNATLSGDGLSYTPTLGFVGSDQLTLTLNDGGASGTGGALQTQLNINLSSTHPIVESFAFWSAFYFPPEATPEDRGPLADWDGDGRNHLLEYFLGSHPNQVDLVAPWTITVLQNELRVDMSHSTRIPAEVGQFQWSDTLTGWRNDVLIRETLGPLGSGLERIRIRLPRLSSDGSHLIRLNLESSIPAL